MSKLRCNDKRFSVTDLHERMKYDNESGKVVSCESRNPNVIDEPRGLRSTSVIL